MPGLSSNALLSYPGISLEAARKLLCQEPVSGVLKFFIVRPKFYVPAWESGVEMLDVKYSVKLCCFWWVPGFLILGRHPTVATLSCKTCLNEDSVINYFGGYFMIQRESTSLTFSFFLISLACVALVFFPLICPVVETDQMRSSTFHTTQSLTGAAKISCFVKSVTGFTPSS